MSPTDKHRLIQDIYFSLQTTHSLEEVIDVLTDYGVNSIASKIYTQESLKRLLSKTEDDIIIKIADDLNLMTSFAKKSNTSATKKPTYLKKIFISHSHKDKEIVTLFIQILQSIGISPEMIFCSSLEGYGTELGKNFIDDIKNQLNKDVLVFTMLSENFYASPMCLIELGAVWGQTKEHISVAIPPFEFEQMKGVLLNFQGMRINDDKNLDMLKDTLENKFDIKKQRALVWNPIRDILLRQINEILKNNG